MSYEMNFYEEIDRQPGRLARLSLVVRYRIESLFDRDSFDPLTSGELERRERATHLAKENIAKGEKMIRKFI